MNAAEIIEREVQSDSSFQVRQLLTERIGKPRKAPHRLPHGEIAALYKTGGDVRFVGPSVNDSGYDLRDSWWGVPRFGAVDVPIPEQLNQLSEVAASSEYALNRAVEVIAVRGDLEAIFAQ